MTLCEVLQKKMKNVCDIKPTQYCSESLVQDVTLNLFILLDI
jgi:hypothetical protein